MAICFLFVWAITMLTTLVSSANIVLWDTDKDLCLDPVDDLKMPSMEARTKVLYDGTAPFNDPDFYALNTNDILFDRSSSDGMNPFYLMTSIVQQSSNETGKNSSIVYVTNNSVFMDNRTFGGTNRKETDLGLVPVPSDKTSLISFKNETGSVTNCMDARFLNNILVVVCKKFKNVSFLQNINNSKIILLLVDFSNNTNSTVETIEYRSLTPAIPSITWPMFATSLGKEEMYLLVVDDDLPNGVMPNGTNNTIIAFMAGLDSTQKTVSISRRPVTFIFEQGDMKFNLTTAFCSSFTQGNTLTINGGTVNARNILLAFFLNPNNTPYEIICYNKDETEYTEDRLRNLFVSNENGTQNTFRMTCRPAKNDQVASVVMDKIYNPEKIKEVDIYFRVSMLNTKNVTVFYYEFLMTRVSTISSSSSLSFMGKQAYFTKQGWFNKSKIVIVIPDKLFYVCWSYDNFNRTQNMTNDPMRTCTVIDVFTIDNSKMKTTSPNEISTYIQDVVQLHSRQYGPFSSANFDFTSNGTLSRMLAYYNYTYEPQSLANGKVLQVYDLSRPRYSVFVDMSHGLSNNNTTKLFSVADGSSAKNFELIKPGAMHVNQISNEHAIPLFFSDNKPFLLATLTNNILAPEPRVTCNEILPSQYSKCLVTELWKYPLIYTPPTSPSRSRLALFENRYIDFIDFPNSTTTFPRLRMGYYDLVYGNVNGSQFYQMTNLMNYTENSFIGSDLFKYDNFERGEKNHDGLYLYFTANKSYGVVRFDYDTGSYKSAVFDYPVRVFESVSRYFIVGYKTANAGTKDAVTNVLICFQLKNNGESADRDLVAGCTQRNITLDTGYILDSIDSIYADYVSENSNLKIYILSRSFQDHRSETNILVFLRYTLSLGSASGSLILQLNLDIKRVLDETYSREVWDRKKCIYKDLIVFTRRDYDKFTVISYNSTKTSYFTFEYPLNATEADIRCADDFVDVYFIGTDESIIFKMTSELNAYKRIRSITRNTSMTKAYTFSDSLYTHIMADNRFMLDWKESSKVYFNISLNESTLKSASSITKNYSLSPGTLDKITLTVGSHQPNKTNLVLTRKLQPVLLNPERPRIKPIYIGGDPIELQQKILFIQGSNETYDLERFYSLPFDMFSVRLNNSALNTSIIINRRIRELRRFAINSDYNSSAARSCGFSNYSAYTVRIVDDVMLRVQRRDLGYCMEISLIQVKRSTSDFQKMAPDIMIRDFGVVSECVLLKDRSIYDLDELKTKKSKGDIIEYGVACIYKESGNDFLWLLPISIGSTVNQVFQVSDNLIKVPISVAYTSFKAALVSNSFYYVLLDENQNIVYASPTIINKTTTIDTRLMTITGASFVEYNYFLPSVTGIMRETGLSIDIIISNLNTNSRETEFLMRSYGISPNGQLYLDSKDTRFLDRVTSLSCAFQTNAKGLRNMNCAYLYAGSASAIFYRSNMIFNPNQTDSYVAPFQDIEVKTIRTVYAKGEFFYITLAYSPLTGNRFLMVFRHYINISIASADFPRTNFSSYKMILYDSFNLTNTTVDLGHTDFSVFYIDSEIYVSLTAGRTLFVYSLSEMSVTLTDKLTFEVLETVGFQLVDNLGNSIGNFSLTEVFRKKNPLSFMWLIILGISLGIAAILIVSYLVFKKRTSGIDAELRAGLDLNKDTSSDAGEDSKKRDTFEVEML